jgi:hypothetical protein
MVKPAFPSILIADISYCKTDTFWGAGFRLERVMGLEPTISCLGSKRSTTELHPLDRAKLYQNSPYA